MATLLEELALAREKSLAIPGRARRSVDQHAEMASCTSNKRTPFYAEKRPVRRSKLAAIARRPAADADEARTEHMDARQAHQATHLRLERLDDVCWLLALPLHGGEVAHVDPPARNGRYSTFAATTAS
jgi:hypothetical protein